MFLLVLAYPGCPGQTAVKWLLLILLRSTVMSVSVCLSVCLSVRKRISRTACPIFLPMAVTRSSSNGVGIRYVGPASGFVDGVV